MEQNLVRESKLPAAEYYSENFYLRGVTNLGDEGVSINIPQWLLPQMVSPNLVPYENATRDVNIGTHSLIASGLKISTNTPYIVTNAGEIGWNTEDGTFNFRLLNNTTLQAGQEVFIYGKASGAINNGDVCQFAGVQGNHILVKKAVQSEIDVNPYLIIGIATDNIANNNYGYITVFGKINDVYTTGFALADILYYDSSGSTAGALTKTPPAAPYRKIMMASVIKLATGSAENGKIMVRPTWGMRISDMDDVDGTVTSILDTEVIIKKESNGIWKHITWANIKSNLSTYFSSLFEKKKVSTTVSIAAGDWSANAVTKTISGATNMANVWMYLPDAREDKLLVGTNQITFDSHTGTTVTFSCGTTPTTTLVFKLRYEET